MINNLLVLEHVCNYIRGQSGLKQLKLVYIVCLKKSFPCCDTKFIRCKIVGFCAIQSQDRIFFHPSGPYMLFYDTASRNLMRELEPGQLLLSPWTSITVKDMVDIEWMPLFTISFFEMKWQSASPAFRFHFEIKTLCVSGTEVPRHCPQDIHF